MPTLEEIKDYLGIDFSDTVTNRKLGMYKDIAESYLEGAIGDIPENDERAKQLALFVIEDLYDRGSFNVKENAAIERLRRDFILQLQCEGREDG